MLFNHLTCSENPQSEGYHYCPNCRRQTHHSFYYPRNGWFYQVATQEELDEAMSEEDILRCDICVKNENDKIDGE